MHISSYSYGRGLAWTIGVLTVLIVLVVAYPFIEPAKSSSIMNTMSSVSHVPVPRSLGRGGQYIQRSSVQTYPANCKSVSLSPSASLKYLGLQAADISPKYRKTTDQILCYDKWMWWQQGKTTTMPADQFLSV